MNFFNCAFLPDQKYAPLIPAKKFTKCLVLVTRCALKSTFYPTPQHCHATQHVRFVVQSVDRACRDVQETSAHEILPIAVAHTPSVNTLIAGAHRAEMDKSQFRFIPTARDPAVHPAAVTVDPIPHYLAHKPANCLETRHAVEFRH